MPPEQLLTVQELSEATKIARSTLYEWAHEGYIPHLKVRGCLRFRASEVCQWLEQHSRPGRQEYLPAVKGEEPTA
jgi:excisionase family DNA binding protein